MYLFDTNIISELTKRNCNSHVQSFIERTSNDGISVFLSVITIGEIVKGIEKLKYRNDIVQAEKLQKWYENELSSVVDNILAFSQECAKQWGTLLA